MFISLENFLIVSDIHYLKSSHVQFILLTVYRGTCFVLIVKVITECIGLLWM